MKRTQILLVLAPAALLGTPQRAAAHPMGNFTISHYARLETRPREVRVRWVLDLAEIPAFTERQALDADRDGRVSAGEEREYLSRKLPELTAGLSLHLDDRPAALEVEASHAALRPGAGGLSTLRIEVDGRVPVPTGSRHTLRFADRAYAERTGWREIVGVAGPGTRLESSTVPAADRSRELTAYPSDPTVDPPQDREAELVFVPGDGAAPAPVGPAAGTVTPDRNDALTRLISLERLSPAVLALALLTAFVLGAGHALSPGHGKTMVAAYLVGTRGTSADAAILGLTVTLSHTAGVFLLGFVSLFLSRYVLPERLYPWLGFFSGAAVAGIGLRMLLLRLQGLEDPFHGHSHSHDHGHGHSHGHPHTHASPASTPLRRMSSRPTRGPVRDDPTEGRGVPSGSPHRTAGVRLGELLGLGISGGIVPCPSALVVLLSAIALGRITLGLLLILAFSAGLASVLVGIGMLVVQGARLLDRVPWQGAWLKRLPVFSAAAVSLLGCAIAVQAVSGLK